MSRYLYFGNAELESLVVGTPPLNSIGEEIVVYS